MASEGDDLVSLPSPPPPRPAARRVAIDAALRKFDGISEAPVPHQPPARRPAWATLHRRPAGALVAAALIAVIAIPAIQLGVPDPPEEVTSEERAPAPVSTPAPDQSVPAVEARQSSADQAPADEASSPPQPIAAPSTAARDQAGLTARVAERKPSQDAPPSMMAAPAPATVAAAPPPPPPPTAPAERQAQAQADEAAASGEIVVTGSRIERPSLESASPVTIIDSHGDFVSRLQDAFRANDRRAVIRLVGYPLKVSFDGDARTYHSARDVERDFDRIFTPRVRSAALNMRPDSLRSRGGGRLRGSDRIAFGCGRRSCPSADAIRIWEISP